MPTISVAIIQRQTLDWANMTEDLYREASIPFCRLWERPDDYMAGLVNLWNRTFELDYFKVRQALKTLASNHNSTLPGACFVPYNGYQDIPQCPVYVFIDDDDWLSPGLADALTHNLLAEHDACIWKGCTLGSPTSEHPLFFWGLNGRCMTNNYAVNGRWITTPERFGLVCKHSLAEQTLPSLRTYWLDEWLSVTNKAPCSSVSLEKALASKRNPGQLAGIIEEYNRRMGTLSEQDFERAPWAWPLHQATYALFQQVALSRCV